MQQEGKPLSFDLTGSTTYSPPPYSPLSVASLRDALQLNVTFSPPLEPTPSTRILGTATNFCRSLGDTDFAIEIQTTYYTCLTPSYANMILNTGTTSNPDTGPRRGKHPAIRPARSKQRRNTPRVCALLFIALYLHSLCTPLCIHYVKGYA